MLLGKLGSSVASLAILAILARYLGPERFGVLAVVRSVVAIIDHYSNFSTWQLLIRYGTQSLAREANDDFRSIVKVSFLTDACTALTGSTLAIAIAYAIPRVVGLSDDEAAYCAVYGSSLATRITGMSEGVLRIFDRYAAQAVVTNVFMFLMVPAVALASALDGGLWGCLCAIMVCEIAGNVATLVVAMRTLAVHGHGTWARASLQDLAKRFPGVLRFLVSTNLQGSVKKTQAEADLVIAGAFLGTTDAGFFRVIKQLGSIPARIVMPLEQVLFTELAKFAARREFAAFLRVLRRIAALFLVIGAAVWLVTLLAGEPLIVFLAGEEFRPAAAAFPIYMLAAILSAGNTPIMRAMIALGKPQVLLYVEVGSTAAMLALLVVGAQFGLAGLSTAMLVHRGAQIAGSWALVSWTARAEMRAPAPVVSQ